VAPLDQLRGAGVSPVGVAQQGQLGIQAVQCDEGVGQLRLQGQTRGGEIGRGCRLYSDAGSSLLAHATPEVDFVFKFEAERGAVDFLGSRGTARQRTSQVRTGGQQARLQCVKLGIAEHRPPGCGSTAAPGAGLAAASLNALAIGTAGVSTFGVWAQPAQAAARTSRRNGFMAPPSCPPRDAHELAVADTVRGLSIMRSDARTPPASWTTLPRSCATVTLFRRTRLPASTVATCTPFLPVMSAPSGTLTPSCGAVSKRTVANAPGSSSPDASSTLSCTSIAPVAELIAYDIDCTVAL